MDQSLLKAEQEETQKMYHHIPPYFQDGYEDLKSACYPNGAMIGAPMSSTPDPIGDGQMRQHINYFTPRTVTPNPNPTTIINNNHINFYSTPGVFGNLN